MLRLYCSLAVPVPALAENLFCRPQPLCLFSGPLRRGEITAANKELVVLKQLTQRARPKCGTLFNTAYLVNKARKLDSQRY
jgi:hypothetical protein